MLDKHFKLNDLDELKFFLGVEVARFSKGIFSSQKGYALKLLEDAGYLGAKTAKNQKLTVNEGEMLQDPAVHRRMIGRLLYLTIIRPILSFIVNKLS